MTRTSTPRTPEPTQTASAEILSAQDVRKAYGNRVALKSLSFSLRAGRVMGFLGPNGAGKTTSIRILTTILPPTSGRFVVDGVSSENPGRIRRRIGVLPEGLGFPRQLTGAGYLAYFGQLYGRSAAEARAVGAGLLEEVGLQNRGATPIGSYSHGMRQRLGIARSLVNDPAVVFLDEPTLGLDPRGQHELLKLVRRIARERNKGVVLSSHLLAEVEGICDDVVIMNAGEVVANGTVAEVVGHSEGDGVRIRIEVPAESLDAARRALESSPSVAEVTVADHTGTWLGVELAGLDGSQEAEREARNAALSSLISGDVPVLNVDSGGGRLQDVFLRLTAEAIQ